MTRQTAMDTVARGTLINLATRLLGVGLVLTLTALTARISTEAQGAYSVRAGGAGGE